MKRNKSCTFAARKRGEKERGGMREKVNENNKK
jgi:hypothetical protein